MKVGGAGWVWPIPGGCWHEGVCVGGGGGGGGWLGVADVWGLLARR